MLLSSAASRLGSAFECVDYAASKGAADSLTIGLAKELGGQGVRVKAVRPGLIELSHGLRPSGAVTVIDRLPT